MAYRAKLLCIQCAESDRWHDKPLYTAVVELCKSSGIAGATVFRGLEGYGESGEIHHRRLMARDQPVVIHVVDTPENIERLVEALDPLMDTGTIAISGVTAIRVEKKTADASMPEG